MTADYTFQLLLFTKNDFIINTIRDGISGFIIDWENKGKVERQAAADTQINYDTEEDLLRVRSLTDRLLLCRINRFTNTEHSRKEIDIAINAGADEILLPMVQAVDEVEDALEYVNGRCGIGILIETKAAVGLSERLGELPLSRVYVGLNDLAIDRGKSNIFDSLEDGTIDYIRQFIKVSFGFAGLTLPECGHPIPCRLLISEMARLGCSFTFLRRSFLADIKGKDIATELQKMHETLSIAFKSPKEERTANKVKIKKIIRDSSRFFINKNLTEAHGH